MLVNILDDGNTNDIIVMVMVKFVSVQAQLDMYGRQIKISLIFFRNKSKLICSFHSIAFY